MKSLALLLILPAGMLLWPAGPALAQATPATSSRDELRKCLSDQDELQARGKALDATRIRQDADFKQLQADMRGHMADSPLPNASEEAFTAFRARSKGFDDRKVALEAKADQYDKDVAEFNRQLEARNKRCASLTVTKADRDAVTKERAAPKK